MYTFQSSENTTIKKSSKDAIQILNYIADKFEFKVEELDVPQSVLDHPSSKRLDSLVSQL